MTELVDNILDRVRGLLRQHAPFAGMSRDDFDNNVLADLERDLHRDVEAQIDRIERAIRWEIEDEVEERRERELARKAKPKKSHKGAAT